MISTMLPDKEAKFNSYLKQIKTLSSKLSSNFENYESYIKIDKKNQRFGVWTGDKIVPCIADHVFI